jgi:hypothetical protein
MARILRVKRQKKSHPLFLTNIVYFYRTFQIRIGDSGTYYQDIPFHNIFFVCLFRPQSSLLSVICL